MFQGWATFHVTGTDQGAKTIQGYFKSPFDDSEKMFVKGCSGDCPKPRYFGTYILDLIN